LSFSYLPPWEPEISLLRFIYLTLLLFFCYYVNYPYVFSFFLTLLLLFSYHLSIFLVSVHSFIFLSVSLSPYSCLISPHRQLQTDRLACDVVGSSNK
jgi:hypothetical protein